MLFADLPVQLSPQAAAKRNADALAAVEREKAQALKERKAHGLRRCAVPIVHPVPFARIKRRVGFIGPLRPPAPADFIGPYDLRPFMVLRGEAKAAQGADGLTRKKARALPPMSWLSEVGTVDRSGPGLAGMAAQVARRGA